jgi:DNA-directed RNA polymerase specialized sigma24 family protein
MKTLTAFNVAMAFRYRRMNTKQIADKYGVPEYQVANMLPRGLAELRRFAEDPHTVRQA